MKKEVGVEKTMIIEFCGMAGSGKTTLVSALCNEYGKQKKDYFVYGVSSFEQEPKWKRLFMLLLPQNIKATFFLLLQFLWKSRKQKEYKNTYEKFIKIIYVINLRYHYIHHQKKHPNDILLVDEGMIHSFVDLCVSCKLHLSKRNMKRLLCHMQELGVQCIFCKIKIEEAMKRILNRNRHQAAMDFYSESVLKSYLRDFSNQMKDIYDKNSFYPNMYLVNASHHSENVADDVIKSLMRMEEIPDSVY